MSRVAILVPTYNEIENIEQLLHAIRSHAPNGDVYVIDDASPDGTGETAARVGDALGRVTVLHRSEKKGLGSAYRHGFARVLSDGYDQIVTMDADFSHDPAVIPTLCAALASGAGAAIGSRYVVGGSTPDWPVHRRLLSRWGNRYTAFVLKLPLRDCTSGFRAYSAHALAASRPSATTAEGYAFLTEVLRRLHTSGGSIVETPITFRDRRLGKSKMSLRIIRESMTLVTRWGIADRVGHRRDEESRPQRANE